MVKLLCNRCRHEWVKRADVVKWCPKCKSPYWDKERVRPVKEKK